eukprot:3206339-Amphidinium_carterae.1
MQKLAHKENKNQPLDYASKPIRKQDIGVNLLFKTKITIQFCTWVHASCNACKLALSSIRATRCGQLGRPTL